MKPFNKILLTLGLASSVLVGSATAQAINWASLQPGNRHILNASFGAEYGIVYGLGYGYHIQTGFFDLIPDIEFSVPSGNNLFDDFKTKTGVQVRWYETHHIQFSTRIQGIFRRYENDFVRLVNFGSDLAGVAGYYKPQWFAAAEVGFDKAIVTQFKHSSEYKNQYPDVRDGWYEPTTGGNFYFGLQGGVFLQEQRHLYQRGRNHNPGFQNKTTGSLLFPVGI